MYRIRIYEFLLPIQTIRNKLFATTDIIYIYLVNINKIIVHHDLAENKT